MVPLLPKLRGQFAEFLNHSSPDRLSILYLTTCVGLGYGPLDTSLEAFLDSMGSLTYTFYQATRHISPSPPPGFTWTVRLHAWPGTTNHRDQLPSCVTPSLDYYHAGSQPHPKATPPERGTVKRDWVVSTTRARHGRIYAGTGISTRYPSTTPFGLALGPDLPRAD